MAFAATPNARELNMQHRLLPKEEVLCFFSFVAQLGHFEQTHPLHKI